MTATRINVDMLDQDIAATAEAMRDLWSAGYCVSIPGRDNAASEDDGAGVLTSVMLGVLKAQTLTMPRPDAAPLLSESGRALCMEDMDALVAGTRSDVPGAADAARWLLRATARVVVACAPDARARRTWAEILRPTAKASIELAERPALIRAAERHPHIVAALVALVAGRGGYGAMARIAGMVGRVPMPTSTAARAASMLAGLLGADVDHGATADVRTRIGLLVKGKGGTGLLEMAGMREDARTLVEAMAVVLVCGAVESGYPDALRSAMRWVGRPVLPCPGGVYFDGILLGEATATAGEVLAVLAGGSGIWDDVMDHMSAWGKNAVAIKRLEGTRRDVVLAGMLTGNRIDADAAGMAVMAAALLGLRTERIINSAPGDVHVYGEPGGHDSDDNSVPDRGDAPAVTRAVIAVAEGLTSAGALDGADANALQRLLRATGMLLAECEQRGVLGAWRSHLTEGRVSAIEQWMAAGGSGRALRLWTLVYAGVVGINGSLIAALVAKRGGASDSEALALALDRAHMPAIGCAHPHGALGRLCLAGRPYTWSPYIQGLTATPDSGVLGRLAREYMQAVRSGRPLPALGTSDGWDSRALGIPGVILAEATAAAAGGTPCRSVLKAVRERRFIAPVWSPETAVKACELRERLAEIGV